MKAIEPAPVPFLSTAPQGTGSSGAREIETPVGDERAFFRGQDGPWAEYLRHAAGARGTAEPWIEARNFLLDEGVTAERAGVYLRTIGTAGGTAAWKRRHERYLREEVRLPQPANGIPATLDPARPDRCPATFRSEENFRAFGSAYQGLQLLRLVDVPSIAKAASLPLADMVAAGRAQAAGRGGEPEAHLLAAAFHLWNQSCDLRPTYATFQVDHEELFGAQPEHDEPGWADILRDRLGLAHFDPVRLGVPFPVFVFRYSVSAVPKRKDLPRGRPLAVPTVLDLVLSSAFCPAPREDTCGRVVHLGATGDAPGREVLHPFRALRVDELFRVGEVRAPVPADLWPARRAHLRALRAAGRPEYADHTDPDLEAP